MVLPVFKRSQDLDAKLAYGIQFFWRKFEIFKTLECGRDLKIRSQNCDLRNPPNVHKENATPCTELTDSRAESIAILPPGDLLVETTTTKGSNGPVDPAWVGQ